MKTTSLLFSLLLIALAVKPFSVAAESAPDPVLDTEGKKLRSGVDYYILPVFRGRGGGLTLASTGNESCPLDVVQEQQELEYDESSGQRFVTTGGVEGNPVCDFCKPVCGDIGIYIQNEYRRLALSDVPFKVKFKKA
ncbi:hypothetical protein AAG906_036816 [Vitis piasezkii]